MANDIIWKMCVHGIKCFIWGFLGISFSHTNFFLLNLAVVKAVVLFAFCQKSHNEYHLSTLFSQVSMPLDPPSHSQSLLVDVSNTTPLSHTKPHPLLVQQCIILLGMHFDTTEAIFSIRLWFVLIKPLS